MANEKTDKSQVEKFKQAARELETDESEEAFDRVLKKVAKAQDLAPSRKSVRRRTHDPE